MKGMPSGYKYALYIIPAALAALCLSSCGDRKTEAVRKAFAEFRGNYVLYADRSDFTLRVFDRELREIRKYPVAFGLNPDGRPKLHRGDDRTPGGVYHVVEMLSMDAERSTEPYRKLRRMNDVYWRARDGHYKHGNPQEDLGDNAYGPRFFLLDYPNEQDRARYCEALARGEIPRQGGAAAPIGHGIAIHGNNDPRSIGHLSTSGCVRMFNNDIIELENYVIQGTPVIISR